MTFDEVVFPVYKLDPELYLHEEDGVLWADGKVLDNKNVDHVSLGMRRLKSPLRNLYPLKRGIHTLEELLRTKRFSKFIDRYGKIGTYQRSIRMPYKCHKIRKVVLKDTYCLVRVKGVNIPFQERRDPAAIYAGILYKNGSPWLALNYFNESFKDTWRKI